MNQHTHVTSPTTGPTFSFSPHEYLTASTQEFGRSFIILQAYVEYLADVDIM